ncbi:hypothetical protein ACI1MP_37345 (plasmid) [Kitasatospora griseola]|uniref:hypothetical protein n=1 Tax=Kitasatospora griseola TaxID=2064 RepID=UPI003855F8D7
MINATKTGDGRAEVTWDGHADDRYGWLTTVFERSLMQDVLAALADPMESAQVAAEDQQAAEQKLQSVSYLIDQLTLRQDALIVALRDRGSSWTELARLFAPDEDEPNRLHPLLQRRYNRGRRRADLAN